MLLIRADTPPAPLCPGERELNGDFCLEAATGPVMSMEGDRKRIRGREMVCESDPIIRMHEEFGFQRWIEEGKRKK